MGFPQDLKLTPELEQELEDFENEWHEQERRRRAHWPRVEATLGILLSRAKAELFAQYYRQQAVQPYDPAKTRAILVRIGELHDHMVKVAVRSKSPAELRMRLIRDGTIPDEPVIEELPHWEWVWWPD
jgi:hypothetical protein